MRRKQGFTLIEVLFVILVLAIVSGIALFRTGFDFTAKSKARTTGQRLVSDLRLTRRLAITNHANYTLTVYPDDGEYKITPGSHHTRTIDSDITLSGDTSFVFQPLGNASSGSTLSVSAGGNQYDISIVSATGSISMEEQ